MSWFSGNKKLGKRDVSGVLPDEFELRSEWLELPGLGQVLLKEMTARDRDGWEWLLSQREIIDLTDAQRAALGVNESRLGDPRNIREWLISRCLIDPGTGQPMFAEIDPRSGHLVFNEAEIGRLSHRLVSLMFNACLALNGLRTIDAEDAKKNFGIATPSDGDLSGVSGPGEPLPK